MIRVTIELIPHGNIMYSEKIGEIDIINNLKGDEKLGLYDAVLRRYNNNKPSFFLFSIENIKHKREDNVFILLHRVLNKMYTIMEELE
ncbi:MAG: hypothetical protein GYA16_12235 [Spirochaetes bacterium]|nr:hypothetical protein [Spirochaetota bacterium]